MTTATAPLWCSRCGKPGARYVSNTMDQAHPLATCGEQVEGKPRTGCGRVIGTTWKHEADAIRIRRHAAALDAAHPAHEARGEPREGCPSCEALPPEAHAVAHEPHDVTDRHTLVKHLRLEHGLRADFTNTSRYPLDDLRAIHAGRHTP